LPRLYDDTSRVRNALVSIGRVEPTNTAVDSEPAMMAKSIAHPLPLLVVERAGRRGDDKAASGLRSRHGERPPIFGGRARVGSPR